MNEPTLDTLAGRVERLERENRRLKQGGALVVLAALALALMGQAIPMPRTPPSAGTVEAEAFHLRDKNGEVVGSLQITPEGTPALIFLKWADGNLKTRLAKTRLALSAGDNGPSLGLYGEQGELRVALAAKQDFAGFISAKGGEYPVRVALGTKADGTASLTIYERLTGKSAAVLSDGGIVFSENDVPRIILGQAHRLAMLELSNDRGRAAATVGVSLDGSPFLHLNHTDGTLGAILAVEANGRVGLNLNDTTGKPLVGWVVTPDGKVGNLRSSP